MCKYMVSMETGNAILKDGGRPRISIISQLLLILDNKPWYRIIFFSLDTGLLSHGQIFKLSYLHINEY